MQMEAIPRPKTKGGPDVRRDHKTTLLSKDQGGIH